MISVYTDSEIMKKRAENLKKEKPERTCKLRYIDTIVSKKSVSDSIIGLGDKVVVKISFQRLDNDCDYLCTETKLYKNAIPMLLQATPNIVYVYDVVHCDNFWKDIETDIPLLQKIVDVQKKKKKLQKITNLQTETRNISEKHKDQYNFNVANIIVLERTQGTTFNDLLTSNKSYHILPILFQLFYTLNLFNIAGFKHNDLHDSNIMINYSSTEYMIVYYVSALKKWFEIRSNYLVKIFDFDRSSLTNPTLTIKNIYLDTKRNCECWGECNDPGSRYDTFTIISIMNFYMNDNKNIDFIVKFVLSRFINYVVPDSSLFDKNWGWPHRLCKIGTSENPNCQDSYCRGAYNKAVINKKILSTEDILKYQGFSSLEIKDRTVISNIIKSGEYFTDDLENKPIEPPPVEIPKKRDLFGNIII